MAHASVSWEGASTRLSLFPLSTLHLESLLVWMKVILFLMDTLGSHLPSTHSPSNFRGSTHSPFNEGELSTELSAVTCPVGRGADWWGQVSEWQLHQLSVSVCILRTVGAGCFPVREESPKPKEEEGEKELAGRCCELVEI